MSFSFFLNSTCGLDGTPCEGEDPITEDSASAISTPDVAMIAFARARARRGGGTRAPSRPRALAPRTLAPALSRSRDLAGVARYSERFFWVGDEAEAPLSLRYSERFFSQATFYAQAAAGALPAVSWLHPPIQACDHPCQVGATSRRSVVGDDARPPPPLPLFPVQDVAKGERLLKDVYEALRLARGFSRI